MQLVLESGDVGVGLWYCALGFWSQWRLQHAPAGMWLKIPEANFRIFLLLIWMSMRPCNNRVISVKLFLFEIVLI